MPNPLLSAVGSSVADTVFGGARSLLGSAIDTGFNKKMMNYQNKLNQENATLAYQRQRELTEDSALLNKRGFAKAGINTAFGQNGNVTTASSPISPNVGLGSASPSTNGLGSLTGMSDNIVKVQQSDNIAADSKLKDSQRAGVDIDNQTRGIRNGLAIADAIEEINKKIADTKDINARREYQEIKNDLLRKYGDRQESALTGKLENEEGISSEQLYQEQTKSAYLPAQLMNDVNEGLQRIENSISEGDLTKEKIKEVKETINVLRATVGKINAETENVKEDTEGKKIDNETKRWVQPYEFSKAVNDTALSDLNVLRARILCAPKTIAERWSIAAAKAYDKIENGTATKEDYNVYYRELFREYHNSTVETIREYVDLITNCLPLKALKSGGVSKKSPGLSISSDNIPSYQ